MAGSTQGESRAFVLNVNPDQCVRQDVRGHLYGHKLTVDFVLNFMYRPEPCARGQEQNAFSANRVTGRIGILLAAYTRGCFLRLIPISSQGLQVHHVWYWDCKI